MQGSLLSGWTNFAWLRPACGSITGTEITRLRAMSEAQGIIDALLTVTGMDLSISRETLIKLSLFTASRDRVASDGDRDEAEDAGDDDGV